MDKDDEQIAKEKALVDAMRNAKSNMEAALSRIQSLEYGLSRARDSMTSFKAYVPNAAYVFDGRKKLHDVMDESIAAASKLIG